MLGGKTEKENEQNKKREKTEDGTGNKESVRQPGTRVTI